MSPKFALKVVCRGDRKFDSIAEIAAPDPGKISLRLHEQIKR